jgi:hypothetical protein
MTAARFEVKVRVAVAVYSLIQIKHYRGEARTVPRVAAEPAGSGEGE